MSKPLDKKELADYLERNHPIRAPKPRREDVAPPAKQEGAPLADDWISFVHIDDKGQTSRKDGLNGEWKKQGQDKEPRLIDTPEAVAPPPVAENAAQERAYKEIANSAERLSTDKPQKAPGGMFDKTATHQPSFGDLKK